MSTPVIYSMTKSYIINWSCLPFHFSYMLLYALKKINGIYVLLVNGSCEISILRQIVKLPILFKSWFEGTAQRGCHFKFYNQDCSLKYHCSWMHSLEALSCYWYATGRLLQAISESMVKFWNNFFVHYEHVSVLLV